MNDLLFSMMNILKIMGMLNSTEYSTDVYSHRVLSLFLLRVLTGFSLRIHVCVKGKLRGM